MPHVTDPITHFTTATLGNHVGLRSSMNAALPGPCRTYRQFNKEVAPRGISIGDTPLAHIMLDVLLCL